MLGSTWDRVLRDARVGPRAFCPQVTRFFSQRALLVSANAGAFCTQRIATPVAGART